MQLIHILLVEDNPGDIRLIKEVMKEIKFCNTIDAVEDGQKAIEYLDQRNQYKDVKTPDLILLDLNLPYKNGIETLKEIKENCETKSIPVVILTTSENENDIKNSYYNYANCYVTKPIDFNNFIEVIKNISNFWFSIVKLPQK